MTTLTGFELDKTGWSGSGAYTDEVDAIAGHSTESKPGSIDGARSWLNKIKAQPHVLTELRASAPGGRRKIQMVDLDRAAKALRNEAGGIQTNRNGILQIEVIMQAANPYDGVTEADWLWFGREVVGPMCRAKNVPIVSQVPFHDYPPEDGHRLGREPWRTWGDEHDDPVGLIGHQHAMENSHGDPGNWSRKHYRNGTTSAVVLILEGAGANPEEFTMDAEATKRFDEIEATLARIENGVVIDIAEGRDDTTEGGSLARVVGSIKGYVKALALDGRTPDEQKAIATEATLHDPTHAKKG